MSKRTYDSTVARMAGNIASGLIGYSAPLRSEEHRQVVEADIAHRCVSLARAIVAEVERTEPPREG